MQRPVIIGEVLFDCLPTGDVLGGAHFNVAWHLKGLGFEPLLIGRIGDDALGKIVLDKMHTWNLETRGMQIDHERPTTTTEVTLINGQASYGIPMGKAFDFIDADAALKALGDDEISILYFGTLASRHPVSLAALQALLKKNQHGKCFVDLNLRAPWWNAQQNAEFLALADWVKLTDEELTHVCHLKNPAIEDLHKAASQLQREYKLESVFITRGEYGAFVVNDKGLFDAHAPKVLNLVDTIGAGDTFTATAIAGKLLGWSDADIIERACKLAAKVCEQSGAVTLDKSFYQLIM